ncbi:MAG: ribonucleoside-diphosphate reductase subunit alpha [Verrucomicrobia bacterium]|nr:ribonucleoside-diphosphate reductase subunit alpha [Verrucomicrobiota bacterium]
MSFSEIQPQLDLQIPVPPQTEHFLVRKRDGRLAPFDEARIALALESAFRDVLGLSLDGALPEDLRANVHFLTAAVTERALKLAAEGRELEIELIQDLVESELMRSGQHAVARSYILYREERKKARLLRDSEDATVTLPTAGPRLRITLPDGVTEPLDPQGIRRTLIRACAGFEDRTDWREMAEETLQNLYDGVTPAEIDKAMIFAAKARVERDPAYSFVAARLLLNVIYEEVCPPAEDASIGVAERLRAHFADYIKLGVDLGRLDSSLLTFDLDKISAALRPERDQRFNYMGIQTIYDRYLIHEKGRRIEAPQYFWMRVAMGLAVLENAQKNERAIEFYELLSSMRFCSSTPTLFNSGTLHPQLSSCYLSTVMDDLEHIFKVISDDAKLSKWAGGLGNDWTNVRATGAHIHGTNGESQGVVPFLKVANDTAVAVNQGGKRKGAMCAYLETWHLDIEDFLELRKNTGDERRRTHDMNTANWIPDLFMKRVLRNEHWTLFNPSDCPDLHELYGRAFEQRYLQYEAMADRGDLPLHRRVEAVTLWRKMLTMLFETGHPWLTFKDPSNLRSPQDHVGVVHNSNLCTEILLNTSADEIAVCNLGSINLAEHIIDGRLDAALVANTVYTAMRMLDNVIDINFYPVKEARNANLRHRPVGLGFMGFQDALYKLNISYASEAAVEFADRAMELISYHAILASTELARERGAYATYQGSKWDRGLLPIDTIQLLTEERGEEFTRIDRSQTLDWEKVRAAIRANGMRNSNTMAIAPTATISNISGVSQSIEPAYKHLFAKSNLSGEFANINTYLVEALKKLDLWDAEMVADLKYYDGTIQEIDRIPDDIKEVFRTAFEIEPRWLIECASRRQKWIDMGQSLNLYLSAPNGRKLSDMYHFAWQKGLKTTYYLRTLAATQIEKSTLDVNRRGVQPRWMKSRSASAEVQIARQPAPSVSAVPDNVTPSPEPATAVKACSILDPTCESCQ